MSIGDIHSTARGSGARYNEGKPAMELIPLRAVADSFWCPMSAESDLEVARVQCALEHLGEFQITGKAAALRSALRLLTPYWEDCARVFEYGRTKYASWNWIKGMPWSSVIGCAARHAHAYLRGDDVDHESGLSHIGHLLCNIVMLYTFVDTYPEGNDLPPSELFGVAMSESMASAVKRDVLVPSVPAYDRHPPFDPITTCGMGVPHRSARPPHQDDGA